MLFIAFIIPLRFSIGDSLNIQLSLVLTLSRVKKSRNKIYFFLMRYG